MTDSEMIELGVSQMDIHQEPPEVTVQNAVDIMVKACGGNRKKAFDEVVRIAAEILMLERKQ